MPTFCIDCIHVHRDSRKQGPWYWLCSKHPRLEGYGFVTDKTWDNAPPFLRCRDVNGGVCPLYEKEPEHENL